MIQVICSNDKCSLQFGITEARLRIHGNEAVVTGKGFACPYCGEGYTKGDGLDLFGVSGGVNIGGGGSITIGGDIAGRDLIRGK